MGSLTKRSILGVISGKVGSVVLVPGYNMDIIKSLPERSNKNIKGTLKQNKNRAVFKMVEKFFGFHLDEIFEIGYQFKRKQNMPERSAAKSYHLLNAVVGEYPDFSIDLSKIKFSRSFRSTENGWNASFSVPDTGGIDVSWEMNPFPLKSTRMDDIAVIVLLNLEYKTWYTSKTEQRSNLSYHFNFRSRTIPVDYCAWIFFASADGKLVSETKYLGTLKMT